MNKYEIVYPTAEEMLNQERLSVSERQGWERIPLEAYRRGENGKSTVAASVAIRIEREIWLEEFAQPYVDRIRAIVHSMGNVETWQAVILEEAAQQIREGRPMALTATRFDKGFYGDPKPETFRLYPKVRPIFSTSKKVA